MANNKIYFENPKTGKMKEAPVGFSWTYFFFGPIPLMFRGAWKWFFISIFLELITFRLSGIFLMFMINKFYIKELISEGYKVKSLRIGTIEQVSAEVGYPLPALEVS